MRIAPPLSRRPRLPALLRDSSGLALVEFTLALPVLLTLGWMGLELANVALAHLKVSQMAMTVADNAGRVITRVDESDINEIFSGAKNIGAGLDFEARGKLVLSSLQDNGQTDAAKKGQMINWQRCFGSLNVTPAYGTQGKGRTDASLQGMGPTATRIRSLPGTAVMFVEATYEYKPLINSGILGTVRIRYESAFNVRERVQQDISNSGNLPLNSC